jgi:hypothetical protein
VKHSAYCAFAFYDLKAFIIYVTEKDDLPLGADTDEFAVLALNHLARSFQQCRDTQTIDAFSLAMQVDTVLL